MKLPKKKAKGELPSPSWLCRNGRSGLYKCIRENKEMFAHIYQENNKGKTPKEQVKIAEQMCRDNEGILQGRGWLHDNGFIGLVHMLQRYPEKFAHIPQKKERTYKQEYVKKAEQMCKKNSGILQSMYWLKNNGYGDMVQNMYQNKSMFAHIPQEKESLRKTSQEWVPIAEQICRDNGGILQGTRWLCDNGYSGLTRCMYENKKMFAHIPQENLRKTPQERVEEAEQLCRENGGRLQNAYWLQNNGYVGLVSHMYGNKKMYAHIPQDKIIGKTPQERVKEAKQLCKDNGGALQKMHWLRENGHEALVGCMKNPKHKHLFKGMKQEYKNGVRIIGE